MELIICLIAFGLLAAFVIYIVLPLVGILSVAALAIGVVVGIVAAIQSYAKGIQAALHPYSYYEDTSKYPQPARRSYFFGPGMKQLGRTIRTAWHGMGEWLSGVTDVTMTMLTYFDAWWVRACIFFPAGAFAVASYTALGLLGGMVTLGFCMIHAGIVLSIMAVIYAVFGITWIIDHIYLRLHSIRTSCPYCQEQYLIPVFECPSCGERHTKLVPGPYGIWHRKCTCGQVLATTFLNGRSNLTSYCPNPNCGNELAASDAQQVAISVVGGSSSGKTVLLSAFYHNFFEILRSPASQVTAEIPDIHSAIFEDLENWYQGMACAPTAEAETATMYSVLLNSPVFSARKQFSVYDIAGEAFRDPSISAMIPQKQFKYADGIVIVIDPLTSAMMRSEAANSGDDIANYSEAAAAAVITNFVAYLQTTLTSTGISRTIQKPVSVVITKSDLSAVKRRISYTHIRHEVKQGRFEDFDTARDQLCQEFLADIGMNSVVQAVTAAFQNVHYYPVSAIGHEPNGESYDPEHVMEPFTHIIAAADPSLVELTGLSQAVQIPIINKEVVR